MTHRSNDEIADALRGLSSGGPPPQQPPAGAPVGGSGSPPPVPIPRAPGGGAARPARPVEPGAPISPPRAPRPTGPGATGPMPAIVARRPVPTPGVRPGAAASQPAYDDDAVIMPAPSPDYLGHVHHPAAPKRPARSASGAWRRTLVPVQLTAGALLVTAAALKYVVDADAPLAAMPTWLVAVLGVGGVVIAVGALLNGLHVARAGTSGKA